MGDLRTIADRGVREAVSGLGRNRDLIGVTMHVVLDGEDFALTFRKLPYTRSTGEQQWWVGVTVGHFHLMDDSLLEEVADWVTVDQMWSVPMELATAGGEVAEACMSLYWLARAAIVEKQAAPPIPNRLDRSPDAPVWH